MKKLPGSVKEKIYKELKEAREYIYESRPPRFAVIGRRGSRKSSSINAPPIVGVVFISVYFLGGRSP